MGYWDTAGQSDEWYTPKYIFDAMRLDRIIFDEAGFRFDLDVAAPVNGPLHVPCSRWLSTGGLEADWDGFVWMNSPFGGRNGIVPWLDKFFAHGNGVALTPDRTSAPWWQDAARKADCVLFVAGKVKFIKPDGTLGKSPSNGTTLMASGRVGVQALVNAESAGLGFLTRRNR